jgi:stage II sporulation protein P
MNTQYGNVCRPPFLKGHTYNQEIAPYSLLLEIGSEGNSLEEAIFSARLVGEALSKLVSEI